MNCCKVICLVISVPVVILLTCCGKVTLKNPVVSGFSPASGVVGTQVTISGSRFDPAAGNDIVRFNGIQATIVSADATQIVATVPPGATSGPITVTTSNGTSGSSSFFIVLQLLGGSLQGVVPIFTNTVSTVAGSAGNPGSADGLGGAARFNGPFGVTTDGFSVFITDRNNHTIRRMEIATGNVLTVAGTPGVSGSSDGTGSAALFNSPSGITTDGSNLYISDTLNNTIRSLVLNSGVVATLAGSGLKGLVDGFSTATRFDGPSGITTDGTNLFIADQNNNAIRKLLLASQQVSTIASSVSGNFNGPSGISTDGFNLYIADLNNEAIRTLIPASGAQTSGQVVTIAGFPAQTGTADGIGTAARFNNPAGITNTNTSLFIADSVNHTIRMLQ